MGAYKVQKFEKQKFNPLKFYCESFLINRLHTVLRMGGKCDTNCPGLDRPNLFAEEKVFMNAKAREFDQWGKAHGLSQNVTESNLVERHSWK